MRICEIEWEGGRVEGFFYCFLDKFVRDKYLNLGREILFQTYEIFF